MPFYYFDSSALVKRYAAEMGSQWVHAILDPAQRNEAFVSLVTGPELTAALWRRVREGSITRDAAQNAVAAFTNDFGNRYRVHTPDARTARRAIELTGAYDLRGFDSIQLATVLELRFDCFSVGLEAPVLVSCDDRLNHAARAEGLTVENPADHVQ